MSETLFNDLSGEYEVSTIRTDAGGAAPSHFLGLAFFSSEMFKDENPWPFETMVFRAKSRKGLYHEPYATKEEAEAGHTRILSALNSGILELGKGVEGEFGNPSLTAEQWRERLVTDGN